MESTIIDAWLAETLAADGDVSDIVDDRIYADLAPPSAVYPFIVFQEQSPMTDVRIVGPNSIMVNALYVVKGTAQTDDFSVLAPLASAINAAIQTAVGGAVTGGLVLNCVREQGFRLPEYTEGKSYRHLGGIYRIYAQED